MSQWAKKAARAFALALAAGVCIAWLSGYVAYELSPSRICGERGSSVAFKDGDNFRCRDGFEGVKSLDTRPKSERP